MFDSFLLSALIIETHTEEISGSYQLDRDALERFRRCCRDFDCLFETTDCDADFEFGVNEDERTVFVLLTFPDAIRTEKDVPAFGPDFEWATSIETGYTEDGRVRIRFEFPSLWEEIP